MKTPYSNNKIPAHMTAVFTDKESRCLYTREVPVPKPGAGEVLIKIAAAPLNPSDMVRIRNLSPAELRDHIPGIEGSGTIVAAGKGLLPKFFLGKQVCCCAVHPHSGTWAEYCITKASTCFPLGKSLSDEQGAMMLVNPLTAIAFMEFIRRGRHRAIINSAAAGALGRMIEHLANSRGVKVINIVRCAQQKVDLLRSGSTYVLDSSAENFSGELYTLANDLHVTLALEAVGGKQTDVLVRSVAYGGCVIIYGNLSCENPEFDSRTLTQGKKNVQGFYLANWIRDKNFINTIISLFKVKKLLRHGINITVQGRYALNKSQQAADAYLNNMTSGKVLLKPGMSM